MIILGIETSCDETAAAVLKEEDPSTHKTRSGLSRIKILSNVVASSAKLQTKYGGIIPEQAAREQIKTIIPVIETAIHDSRLTISEIDVIAVTQGPGLIGSLLVGVETAKTLSLIWKKPVIPVNHLIGHFFANWIEIGVAVTKSESVKANGAAKHELKLHDTFKSSAEPTLSETRGRSSGALRPDELTDRTPSFPCLGLLVSGGHTDLVLFKTHGKYEYLGGTRDDAAGECFDKCARLLGLGYPGGPEISKLASKGNPQAFKLPRPMIDSDNFDFSFSGLKTAVANLITHNPSLITHHLSDLCASIEQAIVDSLVTKTIKAAQIYKVEQIMVAGGVAANNKLREELDGNCKLKIENCKLYFPPPYLCTDNAAMIASAAFFQKPIKNLLDLQADPSLSLAN